MSGGGGGGSRQTSQGQFVPVKPSELQTEGWQGMGYTAIPQTYVPEAKPPWMQGWFDMPWGQDIVTGQALTQSGLQPQGLPETGPPGSIPETPWKQQTGHVPTIIGKGIRESGNKPWFQNWAKGAGFGEYLSEDWRKTLQYQDWIQGKGSSDWPYGRGL